MISKNLNEKYFCIWFIPLCAVMTVYTRADMNSTKPFCVKPYDPFEITSFRVLSEYMLLYQPERKFELLCKVVNMLTITYLFTFK